MRYVYSMPYVNQHGGQSQSMVAVEGQGQTQSQVHVPPTSAFAQQQFITGSIPGAYQNPTYQATPVSEPTPAFTGSNYPAPGTTYPMPQTDSAISGYAPYNQGSYGQSPGPIYYTIPSSTGPPVTFSYGGTGQGSILRPATPPNQLQSTGGAGGNQNLAINVAQPGTPNTNSSSTQYMPYTTYPGSRLPASPQMLPYSSGVPPQPAGPGQATFPMLRPGVQVGIPVPCPGNLSHGQSPAGIQHVQSAVTMKGMDLRLCKQPGDYVMDGGGLKDIPIPAGLALNQQMQALQPQLAAAARPGNTNLFRSSVQNAGTILIRVMGFFTDLRISLTLFSPKSHC